MKLSTFAAIAAVIVGSLLIPVPAEAQAKCDPSSAVMSIDEDVAGGASYNQAYEWAIDDGVASYDFKCVTRIKGYSRNRQHLYPYAYKALSS